MSSPEETRSAPSQLDAELPSNTSSLGSNFESALSFTVELHGDQVADIVVVCADKLFNARSILRDHRRVGDEVFERFTPATEDTHWYYRSLADALWRSGLGSWLVDELERTVGEMERTTRGASEPGS